MDNERLITPEPNKKLTVKVEDGENGVQFLVIEELSKRIPIYSIRNLEHHCQMAKAVRDEVPMVVYGGIWAVFKGVKRRSLGARFFQEAKPGRPPESKVPMVVPPEEMLQFIDWSRVHPDFRSLRWRANFVKLWTTHGAPLHIIAPVKKNLWALPDEFKTTPEDFSARYPEAKPVNCPTAAFYWREDPYWRHFATLSACYMRTETYLGVSSFNPHGEEPPYTFEELKEQVKMGRIPFEVIVRDDLFEESGAFSSHTQMRLPLVGGDPEFVVLRLGSFSPDGFTRITGFGCKLASASVKDVRKNPGENLDRRLFTMLGKIHQEYQKEKPLICCRRP